MSTLQLPAILFNCSRNCQLSVVWHNGQSTVWDVTIQITRWDSKRLIRFSLGHPQLQPRGICAQLLCPFYNVTEKASLLLGTYKTPDNIQVPHNTFYPPPLFKQMWNVSWKMKPHFQQINWKIFACFNLKSTNIFISFPPLMLHPITLVFIFQANDFYSILKLTVKLEQLNRTLE